MILCSCNALSEADIRDQARQGVRCPREAYARLGCQPRCGQCLPSARDLVLAESQAFALA